MRPCAAAARRALAAIVCVWLWARRVWALWWLPSLPPNEPLTRALLLRAAASGRALVRLPKGRGVLVTDAELSARLLERSTSRDVSQYERYSWFLGGALVLLRQGSSHAALRSALLPLFSAAATRRAHPALVECAERLLDRLSAACPDERTAAPLYRSLQHFTLDVAAAAFLAHRLSDSDSRRLIVLLEEMLAAAPPAAPPASEAGWRERAARLWPRRSPPDAPAAGAGSECGPESDDETELSGRLRETFERLCDRLVVAQEVPAAAGELCVLRCVGMARGEARAQSVGLLFAALNSAKELAAALTMLARYPALQEAVAAEADAALPAGGSPTYDDLEARRLPACNAFLLESLRLSPGIEHVRLTATEHVRHTVASTGERVFIPQGTALVVSPQLLHRHPWHWPSTDGTPSPSHFQQGAGAAAGGERPRGSFLPFSAGPKGCVASQFALHEMRLLLVMAARRFNFVELDGGARPRKVGLIRRGRA